MCKITHKQIRLSGAYFFQDHKVIFKHFSRKISHFQGRLQNQALFKTAFKFKHFSRSVGTMTSSYTAHSRLTGGMPPCGCLCGGSCGACGGIPGMGWCGGWWWPGMAGCCMPPYMSPGPGGCCIMGWRSGPRSGTPRSPLSSSVRWSVWDTSWMCCIMLGSARRAWTFLKVWTTNSHTTEIGSILLGSKHQGLYSLWRRRLISIGIPIINLRRSSDRLRFIVGIPIPVRRRLLSE